MREPEVFLDTNVFIYAAGVHAQYRPACQAILKGVLSGEIAAATSTEVLQEIVYHYHARRMLAQGLALARDSLTLISTVLPVVPADVEDMLELVAQYPRLSPRDALHAAVALRQGLAAIVSADRGFDGVSGLRRVDPLDLGAPL